MLTLHMSASILMEAISLRKQRVCAHKDPDFILWLELRLFHGVSTHLKTIPEADSQSVARHFLAAQTGCHCNLLAHGIRKGQLPTFPEQLAEPLELDILPASILK